MQYGRQYEENSFLLIMKLDVLLAVNIGEDCVFMYETKCFVM